MDGLFQIKAIKAKIPPQAWPRLMVISHPDDRYKEALSDQEGHVMSCPAAPFSGPFY